jgi:predicted amidohydrolase YtcJ
MLFRRYDHVYFANSLALPRARIAENTLDPRSGRYGCNSQTHKLDELLYGTAGEPVARLVFLKSTSLPCY